MSGADPGAPNFEAQIFAATATPLRDVGKIPLGPPPTQILDPHLEHSVSAIQNNTSHVPCQKTRLLLSPRLTC